MNLPTQQPCSHEDYDTMRMVCMHEPGCIWFACNECDAMWETTQAKQCDEEYERMWKAEIKKQKLAEYWAQIKREDEERAERKRQRGR